MIQRKLKDLMSLRLDKGASEAFTSSDAKIKATPTGAASISFATNGVAPATASANLNMFHVEQIRDYMYGTLKVPAFQDDDYICLLSTKAKRGIVNDSAWEEWHKYTDPSSKYNSEIGRIENIRFVEVNNFNALSNGLGTGSAMGEAVFFGLDAVAMAIVLDPELRAEVPGNFGRRKAVAWYGISEFGVIWDTGNPGEARIVHLTSL
jgi:N4-gp56 family major capsid protein